MCYNTNRSKPVKMVSEIKLSSHLATRMFKVVVDTENYRCADISIFIVFGVNPQNTL